MRRVWSIAVLTATLTAMGGGVAVAQDEVDGSNSAIRRTDINCTMRQSPSGTPSISTPDAQAIITSSGVITLVCRAKVDAGSVEPFTQTGFPCRLGSPTTLATTSHIVWTPSGQGTLTCSGKF
jgi:hypothetical protein